eukprot:gene26070-11773_t
MEGISSTNPPFLSVHNDYYKRETQAWLARTEPKDKERFQGVMMDLRNVAHLSRPPPDAEDINEKAKIPAASLRRNNPNKWSTPRAPQTWAIISTKAAANKRQNASSADSPKAGSIKYAKAPSQASPKIANVSVPISGRSIPPELLGLCQAALYAEQQKDEQRRAQREKDENADKERPQCSVSTQYNDTYGLADSSPELYQASLEAGRAKQGELREKYMQSTYGHYNDQVIPGGHTESEPLQAEAFFKWMQKQRMYYNDLFTEAEKEDMDKLLLESSLEKKQEMLAALRQVHSAIKPGQFLSQKNEEHCRMISVEDPELLKMTHDMMEKRNHGLAPISVSKEELDKTSREIARNSAAVLAHLDHEPEIELRWVGGRALSDEGGGRPSTAPSAEGLTQSLTEAALRQISRLNGDRPGSRALRPTSNRAPSVSKSLDMSDLHANRAGSPLCEMFRVQSPAAVSPQTKIMNEILADLPPQSMDSNRSTLPIKWAGMSGNTTSAYTDQFKTIRPERFKAVKQLEACAPIGAVNYRTSFTAVTRCAYPINQSMVQKREFTAPSNRLRQGHVPYVAEDHKRATKEAADLCRNTRMNHQNGQVPLGRNGITLMKPSQWKSEHVESYVPLPSCYTSDDRAEQAKNLKAIWEGPTASTGRCTRSVAQASPSLPNCCGLSSVAQASPSLPNYCGLSSVAQVSPNLPNYCGLSPILLPKSAQLLWTQPNYVAQVSPSQPKSAQLLWTQPNYVAQVSPSQPNNCGLGPIMLPKSAQVSPIIVDSAQFCRNLIGT